MKKNNNFTMIRITKAQRKRLNQMKSYEGFKSYSDLIEELIDSYFIQ